MFHVKPRYKLFLIEMRGDRAFGLIFGRRPGALTGEFADGHRVITGPVLCQTETEIETKNSIYELVKAS